MEVGLLTPARLGRRTRFERSTRWALRGFYSFFFVRVQMDRNVNEYSEFEDETRNGVHKIRHFERL